MTASPQRLPFEVPVTCEGAGSWSVDSHLPSRTDMAAIARDGRKALTDDPLLSARNRDPVRVPRNSPSAPKTPSARGLPCL